MRTEKIYDVQFTVSDRWHYDIMQILAWFRVTNLVSKHQTDREITEDEYRYREIDRRCKMFEDVIHLRKDPNLRCSCGSRCAAASLYHECFEREPAAALPPPKRKPKAQSRAADDSSSSEP